MNGFRSITMPPKALERLGSIIEGPGRLTMVSGSINEAPRRIREAPRRLTMAPGGQFVFDIGSRNSMVRRCVPRHPVSGACYNLHLQTMSLPRPTHDLKFTVFLLSGSAPAL